MSFLLYRDDKITLEGEAIIGNTFGRDIDQIFKSLLLWLEP